MVDSSGSCSNKSTIAVVAVVQGTVVWILSIIVALNCISDNNNMKLPAPSYLKQTGKEAAEAVI